MFNCLACCTIFNPEPFCRIFQDSSDSRTLQCWLFKPCGNKSCQFVLWQVPILMVQLTDLSTSRVRQLRSQAVSHEDSALIHSFNEMRPSGQCEVWIKLAAQRNCRLQLLLSCYHVTTIVGDQTKFDCRYTGRRCYFKERIFSAEESSPESLSLLRDCRYKGRRYKEHLLYRDALIETGPACT